MKKKDLKDDCKITAMAVKDTLEVLNGKWKFVILAALQNQRFRFKELSRFIGITPQMLARELQALETNRLVSRTVLSTKPVSVEYAITKHGKTLDPVIYKMRDWGLKHRNEIMK